jgi:hypothetical protein
MQNNTLQQYKNAIRKKYEIEKEGKYFDYLYQPSRGKLRDLCWLIFENNPTNEDLNVFSNLLGLDFDHTTKNKFKQKKDKFRPIETFFKGETDPSNIDAINMAATMVGFELRPFKKFYENSKTEEAKPIKRLEKTKAVLEKKSAEKNAKKRSFFRELKSLFF